MSGRVSSGSVMSELLAAAAAVLNAPEELVLRSAEAKAQALGGTADDYLAAWGGGQAPPAPSQPAAPAPPAPAPVMEQVAPTAVAETAPPPPEVSVAEEVVQPEAAAVVEEPGPPVDPAPLKVRRKLGGRLGSIAGAAVGLVTPVALSPWLAARADTLGEDGPLSPSLMLSPDWTILGLVALFGLYGIVLASFTAAAVGWHGPGMRITEGRFAILLGGLLSGFVTGAAAGGVTVGMFGTEIPGAEEVEVSVLAALAVVVVAGAFLGWAVGQLSQVLGVPEGMTGAEGEEADNVRSRLGSALALPVTGVATIALLVLPAAYLFLSFPGWAPITGSLVAIGILGFAGLSASRPGMRITRGEFLMAAAGIGVVVFILVAVLNTQGAGHGEEEEHGVEAEAAELIVLP